jgi:hypothetical protein
MRRQHETNAEGGISANWHIGVIGSHHGKFRLLQLVYLAWLPAGPAGLLPDVVRWS